MCFFLLIQSHTFLWLRIDSLGCGYYLLNIFFNLQFRYMEFSGFQMLNCFSERFINLVFIYDYMIKCFFFVGNKLIIIKQEISTLLQINNTNRASCFKRDMQTKYLYKYLFRKLLQVWDNLYFYSILLRIVLNLSSFYELSFDLICPHNYNNLLNMLK